ncbi:MAG: ABC transporter permease [Kiritimatiellae bacterium]|nr:ABC transporter permease [Kiritimatiellia bacterium]
MITREPTSQPPPRNRIESAGRTCLESLRETGVCTKYLGAALWALRLMPFSRRMRKETVAQMFVAGIKSLPVITFVAIFTGMILALQLGLELQRYSQEIYIGSAVMVSLLREMGPFMTGLILAACVGSSMAAQIGTMSVNDEIAALEIMSIDPVRFLMAPRLAAMLVIAPVMSFYTCMMGVLGGGVVGMTQLNINWSQYIQNAMEIADLRDLYVGLLKAVFFGMIIATTACYEGFSTRNGAVGVGQATRRSVIAAFLLILVVGYFVTRLFYNG